FRLRSADRRYGLEGTAGHWRPFRSRAWLRRTAARVRQSRERAMARFSPSDVARMTRTAADPAGASWDSNSDPLYLAKVESSRQGFAYRENGFLRESLPAREKDRPRCGRSVRQSAHRIDHCGFAPAPRPA